MPCAWTPEVLEAVQSTARQAGFALAGVAAAPPAEHPEGALTAARFTEWVDLGRAGEMDYLKRRDEAGDLLRRSARVALPWARSVLVLAFHYNLGGPSSLAPTDAGAGWVGRYAWLGSAQGGPTDYHDELLERARQVEATLQQQSACTSKVYVDTGPVLERDFAARAGIGWTGKNTCILNQQLGSWLLLAVIVTSLELPAPVATLPAPDRCGSCTRCLDACPTGALVAPREMDAARCIAYLTIEKKGTVAEELREGMGRQVFGCDICQDVCPWNQGSPSNTGSGLTLRQELVNPSLAWLAQLDAPAFKREFKGTPLERTKRGRLQRNVAIGMGNSGEAGHLPQLEQWAAGGDSVLAEAASWALAKLHAAPAALAVDEAFSTIEAEGQ